jgi:hypothetical protein
MPETSMRVGSHCQRFHPGPDGDHDLARPSDERPRGSWYSTVPVVAALCAAVALAVGIAMSAILVVSRESVQPAGAVIPTQPATASTTANPPTASASQPSPTQAPSRAPGTVPSTVAPSVTPSPKPPETTATHSSTPPPPNSVHPTSHRAFPQETTDFPGPPGTNG